MLAKARPNSRVTGVRERTGGQLSSVYEVGCAGEEPVIVKVYKPEWAWKQAKEVHVYGLLAAEFTTEVPQVLHAEPAGEQDAFTVLTKLEGLPLSEATPPDWHAVYVQVGQLLKRLHQIPQTEFGYLVDTILEPMPDAESYLRSQFTKKLAEFTGDQSLKQRIETFVATQPPVQATPVLCHNDFHEGNLLIDPATWRITGFIDVENAIAADPLLDVAKTIAYAVEGDAAKLQGLTDGYGEFPADVIALYQVFHWLELWVWFASIGEDAHLDGIAALIAGTV
ncbi:aminoglycoside phosphotransferase family protein [Kribbella sandramycini]|nr:aminoglycoside phosphotransferase family protein [Kribbella sandramycini]NOL42019.1 aminoglycoside phosphotransferase family protein [Kribbella sandramycini]